MHTLRFATLRRPKSQPAATRPFFAIGDSPMSVLAASSPRSLAGASLGHGSGSQRHHGPGRSRGGNPLIVLVRKRALKVGLKLGRAATDVPGAIRELGAQQERDAA